MLNKDEIEKSLHKIVSLINDCESVFEFLQNKTAFFTEKQNQTLSVCFQVLINRCDLLYNDAALKEKIQALRVNHINHVNKTNEILKTNKQFLKTVCLKKDIKQ